jgi:release factor glutamine methyltransferase
MKIGEAEAWLREQLKPTIEEGEAAAMAALVLEALTGYDRVQRSLHKDAPLNVHQLHHLTEYAQRLSLHEPLQYIIGHCWFHGLKLAVTPDVLIPRPETEELVAWVISDMKEKGLPVFEKGPLEADATRQLKIIDVGTGSGCIALALKAAMPKAEVWGCDNSDAALNVARRNGSDLDIRVDFQGVDILSEAQQHALPSVDIIVSNPPYIPATQKEKMDLNVVLHEPHAALFVPDADALLFYKAILQFTSVRLYTGGSVYLETHHDLAHAVADLFKNAGFDVVVKKDISGNDRIVRGIKS